MANLLANLYDLLEGRKGPRSRLSLKRSYNKPLGTNFRSADALARNP